MIMDASPLIWPEAGPEPRPLLRREEVSALVVALAAHAVLVVWLALKPPTPALLPVPERMTVTISTETADKSTSPDPNAQAAPAIAPVLSENPVPEPAPSPLPQPAPAPQPQFQPPPRPAVRAVVQPQPAKAPPTPAKPPAKPPVKPAVKPAGGGGSRIGNDFLKGIPGGQTPGARSPVPPAQAIGQLRASFAQSILRKVKPQWQGRAPQGVNTDKLVSYVAVTLNSDGSLAGRPQLIRQDGIDDSNRAQAGRHVEEAIRAIQLAAPFDLPADQYELWKNLPPLAFRKSAN